MVTLDKTCRTKTQMNRNGEPITSSRGNFAFNTINLPLIAIEANRDIKKFYKELDKYMKLCRDNLLWRFQQISKRHVYNYPFLMGEHLWYKSETLKPEDEIGEVLKQASISIGFCG
jgi:ribonucleoside-triphosphate reductase